MLLQLLDFDASSWNGTFTTGATGANILSLLCGREAILTQRLRKDENAEAEGVGELGLLATCARAGITKVQVLTSAGHSSLYKAASIVGIGRACVKDMSLSDLPGIMDWEKLEAHSKREKTASIVSVSAGDVNTGRFATNSYEEMKKLRELCDKYGAWLHVDGAFGLFARALPDTQEFATLRRGCEGLELADSIGGDGHKCLNVVSILNTFCLFSLCVYIMEVRFYQSLT
jgi:glutamate/tyrosine decarboxylase-like PLP-dependent enzyme